MKEWQIQKAVIDHWRYLGLPNTLVAAIPNDGARGQPGLTPGVADLFCLGPGFVGFIELKTARGRATKEQKEFIDLCHRNGILAAITYGRDEPIRILEDWGIVRTAKRDTPTDQKMLENPNVSDHQRELCPDDVKSGCHGRSGARARKRATA